MAKRNGQFTPGFGSEKFGCDFFPGAQPNPDSVVASLASGTSVSVQGIRKIGKSSLLAETRERLRAMEKKVIWVDLDTYDTPVKALTVLLGPMRHGENKAIISSIRNWAEKTEMVPADLKTTVGALISGVVGCSTEDSSEKYVDVLFQQIGRLLEQQESDDKPIIIFDELTTLIKYTIDKADPDETRKVVARLNSLLGQLRYWRKANVGICMAVSGSVSFNWLEREYGIRSESINDCVPVFIKELDRSEARKLIELCISALDQQNWNEQLTEELLDYLPAYFPGVIQLAFRVIDSISDPVVKLDASIQDAISKVMWIQYFGQFAARFYKYGLAERNRIHKLFDILEKKEGWRIDGQEALEILDEAVLSENEPDGRDIIYQLMSDSFIEMVTGGFRFSSGLVPAWRNFNKNRRNKPLDKISA